MFLLIMYNTIQYNSFIEDDTNKDREVSADTAASETYYMMGQHRLIHQSIPLNANSTLAKVLICDSFEYCSAVYIDVTSANASTM